MLVFQPAIVPSSVAKIWVLGAEFAPAEMMKSVPALVTTPVGADVPELPGAGIVIVWDAEGIGCPVPSKLLALPDPLLQIQIPLLVPSAIPQGFTRFVSVIFAMPATSATRLVCMNAGETGAVAD